MLMRGLVSYSQVLTRVQILAIAGTSVAFWGKISMECISILTSVLTSIQLPWKAMGVIYGISTGRVVS